MHSPKAKVTAALVAGAALFVCGVAIGNATAQEPSPTEQRNEIRTVELAPMPALGAESAYMGLLLERSRWDVAVRWVALADVGSGTSEAVGASNAGHSGATNAAVGGATPQPGPAPSGDCYGGPVPDYIVTRESQGQPYVWNQGGSSAWGCYQILGSTWNASCSDIGVHGSASVAQQKECASRLPPSAWGY